MKRIHISLGVEDLNASIEFYTALFGTGPSVVRPDYAKWALDDPSVNFAVSSCCGAAGGIHHLGIQTDNDAELEDIVTRIRAAGQETETERDVSCCYARQDKAWIDDPHGVRWEAFRSLEQAARPAQETCCA